MQGEPSEAARTTEARRAMQAEAAPSPGGRGAGGRALAGSTESECRRRLSDVAVALEVRRACVAARDSSLQA